MTRLRWNVAVASFKANWICLHISPIQQISLFHFGSFQYVRKYSRLFAYMRAWMTDSCLNLANVNNILSWRQPLFLCNHIRSSKYGSVCVHVILTARWRTMWFHNPNQIQIHGVFKRSKAVGIFETDISNLKHQTSKTNQSIRNETHLIFFYFLFIVIYCFFSCFLYFSFHFSS